MRLVVHLRGVGVLGPGLVDWDSARAALRTPGQWTSAPTVLPPPARLPAAERRRASAPVKLSLAVAEQACAQAGADPHTLATVFTSSSGDPANLHALCEALALPERPLSPTRFTNSVHNAAAGYWHIATQCRAPSTSLAGHDASFGAGLLEAAAQCVAGQRPVLLVACDVPYPEPLHRVQPLPDAFGVALLLDAAPVAGARRLAIDTADAPPTRCDDAALDALACAIPAARCLALLQALARDEAAEVVLAWLDMLALALRIEPA